MKILIFSDMHISDRGSMMKAGERLDYIDKTFDWIHNIALELGCDEIINGGDLTSSDSLSSTENACLVRNMDKLSSVGTTYHVLGNHERTDSRGDYTSIEALDGFKGHILVRGYPTQLIRDNKSILLVPYGCEDRIKDFGAIDYAVTHTEYLPKGSMFQGRDLNEIKDIGLVFNGHIHDPSAFDNVVIIGSALGSNFGDNYKTARPGIIILDTETGRYERIENPHAPLYRTITSKDEVIESEKSRTYYRVRGEVDPAILDESRGSVIEVESLIVETNDSVEFDPGADMLSVLKEFYNNDPKFVEVIDKLGGNNDTRC